MKIETPAELLNLAVGFQKSQTLFTFVELEIPKLLQEEKLNAEDIARRVKIHPLAMERFLNACVAARFARKGKRILFKYEIYGRIFIKRK